MLSYNDAIASKPQLVQCHACDSWFPLDQAYWYEDTGGFAYDSDPPVVPVCPSCHADPANWLPPAYSAPGYLASRPCEGLSE